VACASCHTREAWSSDARRLSVNAKGEPTTLHSQPMFMAQDQPVLRWHGDRRDGTHQAERSITGSMGMPTAAEMVPLLRRFGYEAGFAAAFAGEADPVTPANYARALAVYQRTLRTPAPFDAFLAGESRALNPQQRAGLQKFVANGCVGCHSGPLLGGQTLQKFGVVKDYWLATGSAPVDQGRFSVTKNEDDRFVFRVAMLRNVAKTAPYFHDGSVDTLERAVRVMAEVQLGRQLAERDVEDIVAFLGSLTGPIPDHYAPPR
jgi:cytochrome c peroxidase